MATVNEELAQRNTQAQNTYNDRVAQAQAEHLDTAKESYSQGEARMNTAQKTFDQRQAENQALLSQRQNAAQSQYSSDLASANARRAQLVSQAQSLYNQRNAEAQAEYDKRSAVSEGKINSMYDSYLQAQNQQYKKALDQGIAAQEEARAGIAKSYQTAANDLSVQAERNKRNMNLQAMANGLNTGTGSQQQLAANQAYMKSYGNLRGEEAAQNAGIDRAIANLKVDYENNIAQALADNNFQRAGALLEDYKQQLAWLDSQRMSNRNALDQMTMNAENIYDNMAGQARGYLNTANTYNTQAYDTSRLNNQNFYDNRYDRTVAQFDAERMAARNSYENALANAQNYLDTQSANNQNWADAQRRLDTEYAREDAQRAENFAREDKQNADKQALIKAETLASFGDFSGYAALYGQGTANLMKQMWIAQNPDQAWRTGAISDADYLRWLTGPEAGGGGGGGGGGWYGGSHSTGTTFDAPDSGNKKSLSEQLKNTYSGAKSSGSVQSYVSSGSAAKAASASGSSKAGGTTVNKSGFSGHSGKF